MTHDSIISQSYHRNGVGGQSFITANFIDNVYGTLTAILDTDSRNLFVFCPLDLHRSFCAEAYDNIKDSLIADFLA